MTDRNEDVFATDEEAAEEMKRATAFGNTLTHWAVDMTKATDVDPGTAVFSLWVNLTTLLANLGWTKEELIDEVNAHATDLDLDKEAE